VARLASEQGVPCIAIAGKVQGEKRLFKKAGFTRAVPLCRGDTTAEESLAKAYPLLASAVEEELNTLYR
jgi:glycerate kinase